MRILCILFLGALHAWGQNAISAKAFLGRLYEGYPSPARADYLGESADTLFSADLLNLIRLDQNEARG
jgi:hypothetical protein